MKLQILALALFALPALPAQEKTPDYSRVCRSLVKHLVENKKVDKDIALLAQAQAKDIAPLAAWSQRAKDLLLAFPEEEDMGAETGAEDEIVTDAKLRAALLAAILAAHADGAEAQAYIGMGKPAFTHLQAFRQRFEMAKREWILASISKARDGQSFYEGQFAAFSAWGKDGFKLILAMLDDKSPMFAPGNEAWLLRAMRDLDVQPKKRQMKRLVALADNLMLDQQIQYLAMLCLADFGDKGRFEAKEAEFKKLSKKAQEWNQRDGWARLGRLYSDARQHEKAVAAFHKGLELRKAESDASLAGLRYNLSCSLAKLGRLDEAFAVFDKVLAGNSGLSDRLLESDKDLDALRRDPRFDKLMIKYKRMGHALPVTRPVREPKKDPEEGEAGKKDDGKKDDGKGDDKDKGQKDKGEDC